MDLGKADFRKILAELYHDACLDEKCDMRETVDLLEGLQETFLTNPTMLAWSNLKLDRGRFGKSPYFELVRTFRNRVFSNYLEQGISEIRRLEKKDQKKAFDLWLEIFTDALVVFEWEVLVPLLNTDFSFSEEDYSRFEAYQSCARLVMNQQWADAVSAFMELAENDQIPKSKRVYFATYVSEILLYHYGRVEMAQSWQQKAKTLAPNHVLIERLQGEIELFNKNFGSARNHLLNAISTDSNHVDAYLFLGDTFLEEQAYATAKQWYEDGSSIHFLNPSPYKNALKLYGTAKWIDEKTPEFEAIISKLEQIELRLLSNVDLYHVYREVAYSYHQHGNLKQAESYYLKATTFRPDLNLAKIDLGYILSYSDRFDEAQKLFAEAAEQSQDQPFEALWAQGWLAEQRKEFKLAASLYEKCVGLRPFGNDRVHNVVGLQYFKLEDYPTAINEFSKAIQDYPDQVVYFDNFKDAAERTGLPEHMEAYHNLLTRYFPDSHLNWNNAGVFFYEQKNNGRAISCYDQAINLEPNTSLYFKNRALAWQVSGDYEKAESDFLQALSICSRPEHLATLEIPKEDIETATKYGRDAELLNYIGLLKYYQNKNQEALEYYSEAIKLDSTKVVFFENRALAKERLEDYPEAIRDYKLALSFRDDPFLYNAIGRLEYWTQNLNEAVENYTKAIEGDPKKSIYWENRALAYEGLGEVSLAEKDYEAALSLGPNIYGLNSYGILSAKLNKHEKAVELFSKAIDVDPSHAILFENRAMSFEKLGQFAETESDLIQSINLEPNGFRCNYLGLFYFRNNKLPEAIHWYSEAIEINPNEALYYENRGLAYFNIGQIDEAELDFLVCNSLHPSPTAYNFLGNIQIRRNEYENAIPLYSKGIELNSQWAILWENRSFCYKKLGQIEEAMDDIHEALRLEPNSDRFNILGLLHFTKFENKEAIEAYSKAIELNSEYSIYWENRGLAKEALGDYIDAIDDYEKSLNIKPDPYVYNKLGEIHRTIGNKPEARANFELAVALDPADTTYRQNLDEMIL